MRNFNARFDATLIDRYLYVIAWSFEGPSKIGQAFDPVARVKAIQPCNPYRLKIYCAFQFVGRAAFEAEQKIKFDLAARELMGEWFDVPPAEMEDRILELFQKENLKTRRWGPATTKDQLYVYER